MKDITICIRLALAWITVAIGFFSDIFPSLKGEFICLLIAFELRFELSIKGPRILKRYLVMIALPVRVYITYLPLVCSLAYFVLAFYGYFFDLLADGDIIPPTHSTSRYRAFCRDILSVCPHTTIGRPGFTCNTILFHFSGFLPL